MIYHTDDLVNVREAAQQCGRNTETVRRWIWGGKLPAQKLGNQLFIKKEDLAVFCRETAVAYRAEPIEREADTKYGIKTETDLLDRDKEIRSELQAKGFKPMDAAESIRRIRAERDEEIKGRRQDNMDIQPGSRSNLIKRMRKLREQIRARAGNINTGAVLEQLRRERTNEF